MSHPQAFHTSCRSGLATNPGFQFNAASPSLDRTLLSRLASKHAGYHVPRDMPLEPTADDLVRFPIALKVAPVDGAGTVVSRTIYVGREFRGQNGRPDEGRFGNYFSHIVVGRGDREPFDGLLGIELWDAPHWTGSESPEPVLADLGPLQPGPLDAERVADVLAAVPPGLLGAVLDAAITALDGGPRVVLVDADNARGAAWIGWVAYALPAAQAQRLTFTTFDGRPRYADDVHLCITTPACDIAFAQHELGHSVRLIDTGGVAPVERPSLYTRVALALAEQGSDPLATAVRGVPADAAGPRRGAWLAITGALTELVEGDELASVVDLLRELAAGGRVALAAETATELPANTAVDREVMSQWASLHRVARQLPADDDSRSLASSALARIVPFAGELPETLTPVAHDTPTQPGVGNLAPWLSAVEGAAGTTACGALIRRRDDAGARRRERRGRPSPRPCAERRSRASSRPGRVARDRSGADLEHIIVAVTEALAERAAEGDGAAREHLRKIAPHPAARATLQRLAAEQRTFVLTSAWLQAEVAEDPKRRKSAATELAGLAASEREFAEIRELWGEGGPRAEAEHVELLAAYLQAGTEPPRADADRALAELMRQLADGRPGHGPPRRDPRPLRRPA